MSLRRMMHISQTACIHHIHQLLKLQFRHLKEMAPLEPEMWLCMSSKKIAWTPHRVKEFAVPLPETANNNKTLQSNWCRPKNLESTSLSKLSHTL